MWAKRSSSSGTAQTKRAARALGNGLTSRPRKQAGPQRTHLPLECLRQVGTEQWAFHVPLGKLHNERLVPADPEIRRIVERILTLRTSASPSRLAKSQALLLPRRGGRFALVLTLQRALIQAAKRAGCSSHVTPQV
jgi:site-specific recombinase XerC